jgi:CHAT domain-containing protein
LLLVLPLGFIVSTGIASGQNPGAEQQAADAFAKNDCGVATKLYKQALDGTTDMSKVALFQRRLGICFYRSGDLEAAAAAYRAGVKAAEAVGDLELELENVHGLSLALDHLGLLDEALALANREKELAGKCGHTPHMERALFQVALVQGSLGRFAEQQRNLEEMLQIARAAKDTDAIGRGIEDLSISMAAVGRTDEAARLEKELLEQFSSAPAEDRARMYANLGVYQRTLGAIRDAEQSYQQAVRLSVDSTNWRLRTGIAYDLGMLWLSEGQFAKAEPQMRAAVKLAEQTRDAAGLMETKTGLAECLLALGHFQEATSVANEALEGAGQGGPSEVIRAKAVLGDIARAQHQTDAAIAAYEEATTAIETLRIAAPGDVKSLEALLANSQKIYRSLVGALLEKRDVERALYWVERSKARVLNDILLRGGLHELSAMTPGERKAESGLYRALFQTSAGTAQAREAVARLETFRRQLYIAHPELSLQRADFAPAGLEQWRSELSGRQGALLEFFILPKSTAVFVIKSGSVSAFQISLDERALEARIREFRRRLASRDVTEGELATELGRTLFGSGAARELANTTDWVISPDGPLWETPFEALKDESGKRLIEKHAISYAPSLTALWAIRGRERVQGKAPLDLFILANPSLRGAVEEADGIAKLFPTAKTVVASGAEANVDVFLKEAPRADLIHIASHAEFNAASPLYSWLRMGPEGSRETSLTAVELARVPLRARLVVLSACETARGGAGEGEGLMGLGWALTGAGADSSVLSHWKVDSEATAFQMIRFHKELKKGGSVAAALRDSALATMKQPGFSHPYYWTSFAVFGNGF